MVKKNNDRNMPAGKLMRITDDLPSPKALRHHPPKTVPKNSWYYRIFKVVIGKNAYFCIKEFYPRVGEAIGRKSKNGSAWTANSCEPFGESKRELIRDLEMMLDDAKRYPVKVERLRTKGRPDKG